MSRDISTTEKVRLAWITALRRQGDRQCHGLPADEGGKVCAMELLREMTGTTHLAAYTEVGARAGLNDIHAHSVVSRNDGRMGHRQHTFSEIADVVEGWFK